MTMQDFILPDIGEGIVECELLKWLVKEGDIIKEDQAVAEVMTDKATVEIPAMHDGVVHKLYYKEGDIAKVHEPLFALQSQSQSQSEIESTDDQESDSKPQREALRDEGNKNAKSASTLESFVLPDIGEGIVECEIMQWHVEEGDSVKEDDVVVEVMTDKAVVEIPAKYNGVIGKLHYAKGDIARVHTPLYDLHASKIETETEETETIKSDDMTIDADSIETSTATVMDGESVHAPYQDESEKAVLAIHSEIQNNKQGENFEAPVAIDRALASPAVRRLAREHNINLKNINASGKKGRILKQDIVTAINNDGPTKDSKASDASAITNLNEYSSRQSKNAKPSLVTSSSHQDPKVLVNGKGLEEEELQIVKREAVKGIKVAMAKQMSASVSSIPHFSVSDELCMDKLIALRQTLKPLFESEGCKLSFMPFFIKALSLAMQKYPIVNSRLNDATDELTYFASHNIGMAVDSKIGLLVPNIKNVQQLSLFQIATEANNLIEKAREGKLSNSDLSKGTISISNIGAIGGITATPVINKPEVAIVALGKMQTLPRFDSEGNVKSETILSVNWSGDHRVIDGATMVKFNNLWMDYLANPEKMLMYLK